MSRLDLVQYSTDKAFYAALKVYVYNTLHETILRQVMGGNTAPLEGKLGVEIGRFTSRKTNYLFVPDGPRAQASAEFFGFTSHKVREKLTQLSEQGVVELVGRGLRDAQTYSWSAPIEKWELCSFMRFRAATETNLSLNLENHRVFEAFADDPFTLPEFVEMFQAVHEAEFEKSRWGKRKFTTMKNSYAYENYLKKRLQLMHKHKLVTFDKAAAQFQLTAPAVDAAQHFKLFSEGPGYKASWDMCFQCPLNRLCNEVGATDLILDLVQHGSLHGLNGHGPNGTHLTNGARDPHRTPLPQ